MARAGGLPIVDGAGRSAPVLDVRDPAHRRRIVGVLAAGRPVAFYMGVFTIMRVIGPGWRGAGADLFWEVKPGRPPWSKLPVFARPRDALRAVDFRIVHPALGHLRRREAFEGLWRHGAPLHVVAPLRGSTRTLHPSLVTTPDELDAQARQRPDAADRRLSAPTASFFWMDDPAWRALAAALALACRPWSHLGGSSFNDHGRPPPYTLDELRAAVAERRDLVFDAVVHDPLLEEHRVHSSHSLVRLPLRGEDPALVLLRWGSVGPDWIEEAGGAPVRVLESVAHASRAPGLDDAALRARIERFAAVRTVGAAP